ncbi:MAG: hypothetical protein Roseis2KO_49010 [Roseivirga sp.]
MKHISKYILGLMLISFFACEKTIRLETDPSEAKVVIEGLITNSADLNYIKLTRSRDFYSGGLAEGIANAEVIVNDNNGGEVRYLHNPENLPELDGVYLPEIPYAGVVGNTYTMSVVVDGESYTAQETLLPVTKIDSLTVIVNEDELADPDEEDHFYEVLFYAEEPQDRVDHYLFKFYGNDELVKDSEEDIYFAEDEFIGEAIDDLPIAGFFALDDLVRVEMYSITREAFIYYNDLFNIINNDGGMFSPPPANPRNNLSDGALGYFQVSAIESAEIVIVDPTGG